MRKLRCLVFDVETSPLTVYAWGRRDVNIALNQVVKDWSVLAFAAKWLGDPPSKMMYFDLRKQKDVANDLELLKKIWKLLDEADIVLTHNGRHFDCRKLNARFILNGMLPPSPYQHIDTLKIVRPVADFTSNSLAYLTDKLCTKYKKQSHSKYPGMELWNACLAGDKKVWPEMQRYNTYDVLSLEEFYLKIRPWAPKNTPSVFVADETNVNGCETCSGRLTRQGYRLVRGGRVRQYKCTACGRWQQGKKEPR